MHRVGDTVQDAGGQRLRGVPPLGRQAVTGADVGRDLRLGEPFGVAAGTEVREAGSSGGDPVPDDGSIVEEEERPLSIQPSIYGNFDLVGVCFAYVDSPRPARPFGMNFVSTAQGIDIWNRILHLTRAGTIRPVIGRQIEFAEVPTGLVDLEQRATIGRTVVRTPSDGEGTPE